MPVRWLLFMWVHDRTDWEHVADIVSFPGERLREAVMLCVVDEWGAFEPVSVAIWDTAMGRWWGLFEGRKGQGVRRVQMSAEMQAARGAAGGTVA